MTDRQSTKIDHPLVADSVMTCPAVPEQYEGTLTDGRIFYFRYRFGHADLGVGADLDAAVEDSLTNSVTIGERYDGEFETIEQRDRVFGELLARAAEMGA